MKTIFVAKREYDREGYRIVGLYAEKADAEAAVEKDKKAGYGEFHTVAELPINQYFDIDVDGT